MQVAEFMKDDDTGPVPFLHPGNYPLQTIEIRFLSLYQITVFVIPNSSRLAKLTYIC